MRINVGIALFGVFGFAGLAMYLSFLSQQAGDAGLAIFFLIAAVLSIALFFVKGSRSND
jgi:hypothetical protein